MTPSHDHERVNRRLHTLVETLCIAWKYRVDNVGSATFKRPDLQKGFEPDTCFYIQHVDDVLGKERLELPVDPPPDLVIEVEVTSTAIDKLSLYAAAGVPEVWRWDGSSVIILELQNGEYVRVRASIALPGLRADDLSEFARLSRAEELTAWVARIQEWARARQPRKE
jgi:Uma2 family endonuclease